MAALNSYDLLLVPKSELPYINLREREEVVNPGINSLPLETHSSRSSNRLVHDGSIIPPGSMVCGFMAVDYI